MSAAALVLSTQVLTLLTCVTSGKSLEVFPSSVNGGVGLASLWICGERQAVVSLLDPRK